jgi:hypothetical protein
LIMTCDSLFRAGWESFPLNSKTSNPYRLNALEYSDRLTQHSTRLFTTSTPFFIRVLHSNGSGE